MWASASSSDGRRALRFLAAIALAVTAPLTPADVPVEEALETAFPDAGRFERSTAFLTESQAERVVTLAGVELSSKIVTYFTVLDAAAEASKELELVRRSGVGVVLPPLPKDGRLPDGFVPDTYFVALDSAAKLHELGVPVALSAHGASEPGERLARQAGYAMRGGLSFDDALAAVTITPARMVGVDDRIGSIEVGKDADLVLWSGTPFEPTSNVLGVLVDGELVLDPRSDD